MDGGSHFSTQEVLDWFCATKPIPKKNNVARPKIPCPPAARTVNKPILQPKSRVREPYHPYPTDLAGDMSELGLDNSSYPTSYHEQVLNFDHDYSAPQPGEEEGETFTPKPVSSGYQANEPTVTTVFDNYSFDNDSNPDLPISSYRDHIVQTIESGQVTIIQGSTGSGKSTQVPQYILEHYAREKRHCNIICTQPRRIAATSIAKFVAKSRGWRLGSLVGYQIAMDKFISEDTRLNFVTTGILLQKLINMKNMNQYTHVILDEVHDRDLDTDFCLLIVKKLLRTNSRHVKVVLMSATIENKIFANYFGMRLPEGRLEPAAVVNVEGKAFSVIDFCLDDLTHIGKASDPIDETSSPRLMEDTIQLACKLIKSFDALEEDQKSKTRGTVLVFLPGMPEILRMSEMLNHLYSVLNLKDLAVLHLHSTISEDYQRLVFLKPEPGKRKIILATNIAESSITVPDIRYVIDFCLVKELTYDPDTNYQCLRLNWASKASLTQRKGRAGRVADGRCYRLISRAFFQQQVEYSTPEMQRCPLESVVLHAKQLDLGEPCAILNLALQPPNLYDIERSILTLKEVGALTVMKGGVVHPYDGDLTFVGQVLATLPVDVRVGKLLILGHVFGCLGECIVIGAALSLRPFFSMNRSFEMRGFKSKMGFSEYSYSDCIAVLNAYKEWCRMRMNGQFQINGRDEKAWCSGKMINRNSVHSVAELVKELSSRLDNFNIRSFRPLVSRYDVQNNEEDNLILKLVIAGAFYPHYFCWGLANNDLAQKEMSGHDPSTTVMLNGLPPNAGQYKEAIMKMFDDCGKGKLLHFEQSRVYLEFERPKSLRQRDTGSTPVLDAVYIALKKRHFRGELLELYVNDQRQVIKTQDQQEPKRERSSNRYHGSLQQVELPKKGFHMVMVSEVVHPAHFWAQFFDDHSREILAKLMHDISHARLVPLLNVAPEHLPGMLCLAVFSEDGLCYRGHIEDVYVAGGPESVIVRVMFVDYGNTEMVPITSLYYLPTDLAINPPAQAFECCLTNVKPSYQLSPAGKWTQGSTDRFRDLVADKILMMNVYSEVGGVMHIELWDKTDPSYSVLINRRLVEENLATFCEESPSSVFAHETAQKKLPGLPTGAATSHSTSLEWEISGKEPRRDTGRPGRTTKYVLKGPSNPYEISFYPMTHTGGTRAAKIARDSVNSIVVDSEPQDKHERMMVASQVAITSSGSTVLARYSTLLPNLHGLPYLVCLLFTPTVEMRTDQLKRQYTGALCGLGYNPATGESLYNDHDIELVFDTLITQEDLDSVNDIRMAINIAVGSNDAVAEWGEKAVRDIQLKARTLLLGLVLSCRESVTPSQTTRSAWNQVSPDDLLPPKQPIQNDDIPTFYPLHHGIKITGEVIDQSLPSEKLILRKQLTELHKMASRSREPTRLFCNVCHITLSCPNDLLRHLDDLSHKLLERAVFDDSDSVTSPLLSQGNTIM